MVWNIFTNTDFPDVATPSVGLGLELYDGWIDTGGNSNLISASGLIEQTSIIANPWLNARMMRPLSESKRNSRFVLSYVAYPINTPSILCYLRGNHAKSTFTGYIPFIAQDGSSFRVYPCVNGVLKTLVSSASGTTTVSGTTYKLDVEVVQTDTVSSTLTFILRNSDGTQRGNTVTIVDTTPELQNIAGVVGFGINANNVNPVGAGRIAAVETYQQPPVEATSYTVTAQTAGAVNIASSNFLVYANNDGTFVDTIITPSDNGGGGTFTPSSITLAALQTLPGSFRYTPGSAGTKTISYTNNQALSNPANTTYEASIYNIVSVLKGHFSPGNWKGDNVRGGSLYRKTWNIGAWFEYKFNASATPTCSLLIEQTATTNTLAIYTNGVVTDAVLASGNTTINGLIPNALNTVRVYVTNSINNYRWNDGINTVQVNGLLLDLASTEIDTSTPSAWGLMIGDSITQGVNANAFVGSFIHGYAYNLERALSELGYDLSVNACSGSGWTIQGNALLDVPAYYKVQGGVYQNSLSRWNRIDENVSLLDSNSRISAYGNTNSEPAFIIINYLTNDCGRGAVVNDVRLSIEQGIVALRTAAPNAALVLVVPPGLYDTTIGNNVNSAVYITALKTAFTNYTTANPRDGRIALVDLGSDFAKTISRGIYTSDGLHPLVLGGAAMSSRLLPKILSTLAKLVNKWTYG